MLSEITSNWLVLALLAPAIWALADIVDVCLVGGGYYDNALDGAVISAGFSALPLLFTVPLIQPEQFSVSGGFAAIIAGICFFLHTLFFLKALFALNDASSAESIETLRIILVPVLAFILLDEVLEQRHYLAIFSATLGTGVLAYGYIKNACRHALGFSLMSVLLASLAMVAQTHALKQVGFANALAIFSISTLLCMVGPLLRSRRDRQRITSLCRRFGLLFIVAECLQQGALLTSQRATEVAPTVSLVIVAESALPLFVIALSLAGTQLLRMRSQTSSNDAIEHALTEQRTALPTKLTALVFIVFGIWLIYHDAP